MQNNCKTSIQYIRIVTTNQCTTTQNNYKDTTNTQQLGSKNRIQNNFKYKPIQTITDRYKKIQNNDKTCNQSNTHVKQTTYTKQLQIQTHKSSKKSTHNKTKQL